MERERDTVFPRALKRIPSSTSGEWRGRNDQTHRDRDHTKKNKKFRFGSRVSFGAVQYATSSASAVLFITTCASVEKKDTTDH